jgi:hypothetical protein
MKKIVLSTLVAVALGTVSAAAGDIKFYTDENGQVFVKPGKGRTELNVNPKEVMNAIQAASQVVSSSEKKEMKEEIKAELKAELKRDTPVFAKSSKLKFSGKHYLGFTNKSYNGNANDTTTNFEMRRNYVQVKAYLFEDPKSYFRVTLDSTYTDGSGAADVYVKYAYLYLNDVLPNTGVEIGMVHRPWVDYEVNNGWKMRSISKVFAEASEASHLVNSSDLGFNLKTKTDYFTSEIGLFNGEGYKGSNDGTGEDEIGDGLSAEWRLTAAILGDGKKKRKVTKDTYFDASFFGAYNMENSTNADAAGNPYDYKFYGLHAVYNTPSFLISAQFITADNDLKNYSKESEYNGDGYSVNGTYRFGEKKQFSVLGRYDNWTAEDETANLEYETNNFIYGLAWQQNKNVKWLLTGQSYEAKDGKNYAGSSKTDWTSSMLTAEVSW